MFENPTNLDEKVMNLVLGLAVFTTIAVFIPEHFDYNPPAYVIKREIRHISRLYARRYNDLKKMFPNASKKQIYYALSVGFEPWSEKAISDNMSGESYSKP